ncbi:MAG: hypothetical protein EDX89_00435 [Acidobacteria bacterium]|nr:MAG: hypothetical protein EDX89_00435 [Acidobacteriota bacterium]
MTVAAASEAERRIHASNRQDPFSQAGSVPTTTTCPDDVRTGVPLAGRTARSPSVPVVESIPTTSVDALDCRVQSDKADEPAPSRRSGRNEPALAVSRTAAQGSSGQRAHQRSPPRRSRPRRRRRCRPRAISWRDGTRRRGAAPAARRCLPPWAPSRPRRSP